MMDMRDQESDGLEEPQVWPQLAREALYGLAGEIVEAATQNSEADRAAVLATLLTLAGITAGRSPFVRVGDHQHHARLFFALLGQSARGRKGTSEGPVRRIAERASAHLGPLNWKHGPMSTGEGLIYNIRDGDGEDDGDPGVEDKRLLIVEGEFAAPLRAMQRHGNTLSTVMRSAWDGQTLEPLTKTSRLKASNPHVGIVGHITHQEMNTLISQVEIFNGFANRFLWCCVRRSKRLPLARGMDEADVIRLGDGYAHRLRQAQTIGEVEFSGDARDLYVQLYDELSEDHEGMYGIVVARAEAQVIRLALTFALIDASPLIKSDHLQAAVAVWEYCDASAKYLFGQASADPLSNRILSVLQDGPMTTTDLHKALGGHTAAADLNAALNDLQGRGRISCEERKTGGRTGKTWHLRPGFNDPKEAKKAKNGASPEVNSHSSLRSHAGRCKEGTCHS